MNTFIRDIGTIQWTNNTGASLASGGVGVLASSMLGIAQDTIAAAAVGLLKIAGEHVLNATVAEAWAKGTQLYWDPTTSMLTKYPGINRPKAGRAGNAKVATTQTTAEVELNYNPDSAFDGLVAEEKSANFTAVFGSDAGKLFALTTAASCTCTLPSVIGGSLASGMVFTVANFGLENGSGCTVAVYVSPAAVDGIVGPNYVGTVNKDWYQALGTAKPGDYLKLISVAGVGWHVIGQRGTWTQEA